MKKLFLVAGLTACAMGLNPVSAQTCSLITNITESVSPTPISPCAQFTLTYSWNYGASTAFAGPLPVTISLPYGLTYQSFIGGTNASPVSSPGTTTPTFTLSSLATGTSYLEFIVQSPCSAGTPVQTAISIGGCTGLSPNTGSLPFANASMTVTLLNPPSPITLNTGDIVDLVFEVKNNSVGNIPGFSLNWSADPTVTVLDYDINNISTAITTSLNPIVPNPITSTPAMLTSLLGHPYIAQNEKVYVHIRQRVVNCSNTGTGNYVFNWGCGSACQTIPITTDINVVTGNPNLQVTNLSPSTLASFANSSFCSSNPNARYGFRYLNNGTPINNPSSFPQNAKLVDLKLYLYCTAGMGTLNTFTIINTATSTSYPVPASVINSLGILGPYQVYELDFTSFAGTGQPFGPNTIEDLDGDGRLDDMKHLATFDLAVDFVYSSTCPPSFTSCPKGLTEFLPLATQEKYNNQCGTLGGVHTIPFSTTNTPSGKFSYQSSAAGTASAPTDVFENVTFNFNICPQFNQMWMTQGAGFNCPNGFYQIKIPLPSGYNFDFTAPGITPGPPGPNPTGTMSVPLFINNSCTSATATLSNAAITQTLVGPGLDFVTINLGQLPQHFCNPWNITWGISCLNIPLKLTCMDTVNTANFGYDNLAYTVEYVCDPNCNCREILACGSAIVFHHCLGPCAKEFGTSNSFTFERQTRGWVNTNNVYEYCTSNAPTSMVPVNANIRLDAAYPSDEVKLKVSGNFGGTGTNYSSMFLQIRYDDFGTAAGSFDVFSFVSGTLTINSSNNPSILAGSTHTLSMAAPVLVGGEVHYNFMFPSSPFMTTGASILTFTADIVLRVKNLPHTTTPNGTFFTYGDHPFTKLRAEYMGFYSAGPNPHLETSCDHWGAKFRILQPKVDCYVYKGVGGTAVSDCNLFPMEFTFRVTPALTPLLQEDFPNEFKPYAGLDAPVTITIPAGYSYVSSQFIMLKHNFSASGTNQFQGSTSYLTLPITPSSSSSNTVTFNGLSGSGCWPLMDLPYVPGVAPTYAIKMMLQPDCNAPSPAQFGWSPSYTQQIQQTNSAYQDNLPFFISANDLKVNHVNSTMSVTAPATVSIVGGTANFVFTICNTSTSTITSPWMAFQNPVGAVLLTGVTGPGLAGPATTYGSGNLLQAFQPLGPLQCVTCTLQVTVGPNGCVPSGSNPLAGLINVQYGYECTSSLPFSDPANANCQKGSTQFPFNIYPSSVDLTSQTFPVSPVPYCGGQLIYSFLIQNPDPGFLANPSFWIQLPAGVSIVNGTYNYPSTSSSAPLGPAGPVGSGMGWNFNITSSGLPGSGSNPGNQILVTCTLQVNCGYNPNNPIQFFAGGTNTCNIAVSDNATHLPSITGVNPADNLALTQSVSNSNLGCNNTEQVTLTVTNTGTSPTQHTNWLVVTIPPPLVASGFTPLGNPVGNTYSWQILPGMTGTLTFTFNISLNNTAFSGPLSVCATLDYNEVVNCQSSSCPISYTYANLCQLLNANCVPCTGVSAGSNVSICANGSTTLTASGGGTYSWSTGQSGASITVSPAVTTTYTVYVFPNPSSTQPCTASVTVTVNPNPTVTITSTGILCNGGTASLTANVSGGTPPYTYLWSPSGGTNATASGLTAGTYTVTVTDQVGCTAAQSYTLTQPPPLQLSLQRRPVCAGACDGSAIATVSGGTPTYTYLWAPIGATTSSVSNLCPGGYTLTITDANGCTLVQPFNIPVAPALNVTITQTPACFGVGGSATVTVTGGIPPYTYSWAPSGQTTASATGLAPGTYTCYVMDLLRCTAEPFITVQNTVISITGNTCMKGFILPTGIPCVTFNPVVSGGVAPISYQWSPGGATTASITVCASATTAYTLTATDANGCSQTQAFVFHVIDARCGKLKQKVLMCHMGNTICVAQSAVPSMQAAGATIGPCLPNDPCNNQRIGDPEVTADEGFFNVAPNPFSGSTTLSFGFTVDEMVTISLYDVTGKFLRTICHTSVSSGLTQECEFNGDELSSGVYIAVLETETSGKRFHQKLVLQK